MSVGVDIASITRTARSPGAQLEPQQMQARVETGGRARTRDDAAVLHVQHVRVDIDVGVHLGHGAGIAPVRRGSTAAEHPGGRHHERPAADGQHPGTALDGATHDGGDPLVDVGPLVPRDRGDDDQVGLFGEREVVIDVDREAQVAGNGAGVGGDDAEIEAGDAVVRAVEPERLAREAELERSESRLDDAGDGLYGRNPTPLCSPATRGVLSTCVALLSWSSSSSRSPSSSSFRWGRPSTL